MHDHAGASAAHTQGAPHGILDPPGQDQDLGVSIDRLTVGFLYGGLPDPGLKVWMLSAGKGPVPRDTLPNPEWPTHPVQYVSTDVPRYNEVAACVMESRCASPRGSSALFSAVAFFQLSLGPRGPP